MSSEDNFRSIFVVVEFYATFWNILQYCIEILVPKLTTHVHEMFYC